MYLLLQHLTPLPLLLLLHVSLSLQTQSTGHPL
jgi:hypothetical protein